MPNVANDFLRKFDYIPWDQPDGWHNTPLCDAIVMGLGDIAIYLIERGARVDRRPTYAGVSEQDLVSLADRKGMVNIAALLRERGCIPQITTQVERLPTLAVRNVVQEQSP